MKVKRFLFILIVIGIIAVILYSIKGSPSPNDYAKEIQDERDAKDQFMRDNGDSPLAGHKEVFQRLKYYPADLKYKLTATLVPIAAKKLVVLPTSDGKAKKYLEYAQAMFELDGVKNKLLVLEIIDPGPYRGTFFLPFADETSAVETYGAGRYLDLKKIPGASSIILDFNKAYNPYCAYSDNYSCPLPPKENILKIAIRAGEKSYH